MVDYYFYTDNYRGSEIPSDEWPLYKDRALAQMAYYKRIYKISEPEENAEKMAICAIAEAFRNFDLVANGEGGAVESAKIGSVSVSYANSTGIDISPKGRAKELYRCAGLYLNIYRG